MSELTTLVNGDDLKSDPSLFAYLDALWGPHSVDCFAAHYNNQIPRFFSRFWNPGTEAVDAFTVYWQEEVYLWVPPLHLVAQVIRHARVCSAVGTLVIPAWKSALFRPLVCPDGVHFANHWEPVQFYQQLFMEGRSGKNFASALSEDSVILALFIDFTRDPRNFNAGFCTHIVGR